MNSGCSLEIDALVQRVGSAEGGFVPVVGPSGSGKSSLVAAGLLSRPGDYPTYTQACDYANVLDSQNAPTLAMRHSISRERHACGDIYPYAAPVGGFQPNARNQNLGFRLVQDL